MAKKKKPNFKLIVPIAIGFVALLFSSLFIVEQTEQAIVLEFRKPQKTISEPGLKFKLPWQTVQYFDKRVLDYNAPVKTIIAGDLKRIEVDAFVKYEISDPLKFLEAVGSERSLISKLDPVLEASSREVISKVPLATLLTDKRVGLMEKIKTRVNAKGLNFGINVVDVRIMRADFPEQNRADIYARMISERQREAKELRGIGAEEATKIRAEADKQKDIILSEAQKNSQITRGEGDGTAAKIYADAYSSDPSFFKFYRSMEAYRSSLKKEDTSVILSPDSEFLKFFEDSNAR